MRFAGKRALVTGGANGIGAATCRRLVDEGAQVIVGDIDDAGAARLASELGPAARWVHLDVADAASWDALAGATAGGVDVVVNNAFTVTVRPAGELSPLDWERQLAVDLSSVYHSVRAFLPSLIDRHGAVVNVASVHAVVGFRGHPAYAAAKGGVTALTRQLSADYGAHVRFNAVLPGAIDTRVWDGADEDELAHHAGLAAMGRFGRPAEVAAAVAFLASDDSSYVCGACLTVDGGLTTTRY